MKKKDQTEHCKERGLSAKTIPAKKNTTCDVLGWAVTMARELKKNIVKEKKHGGQVRLHPGLSRKKPTRKSEKLTENGETSRGTRNSAPLRR